MATEVIKEFLVSLGYRVDGASERRFIDGINKATRAVLGISVGIEAAAAAVAAGVAAMANDLEKLYFASQRTKASVENIQAYGAAVEQLGGNVHDARSSLENLANFLRSSPGAATWIQALGVQVRDARTGLQRDTTEILADLGKRFRQMPIWRAQAYAQFLGIDQNTLRALMAGVDEFEATYKEMVKAVGLDSQKAAADAHGFMVSLRNLWSAFSIILQKVGSGLYKSLGFDIERLRRLIVDNMATIADAIETAARVIIWLADGIFRLVKRVVEVGNDIIQWFNALDRSSQVVIEALAGLLVAWRLFNAGFLTTPLGAIIALSGGLLLLYDDYKTWKEGGKSLIDWQNWQSEIDHAKLQLGDFGEYLSSWWKRQQRDNEDGANFLRTVFAGKWQEALDLTKGALDEFYEKDLKRAFAAIEGLFSDFVAWISRVFSTALRDAFDLVWSYISPIFDKITAAFNMAKAAIQWIRDHTPNFSSQAPADAGALLGQLYRPPAANEVPGAGGSDRLAAGRGARRGGLAGESGLDVQHAISFFEGKGWSLAQAAGLVANLYAESSLDPTAVGDGGQAIGVAQWHPDRQAAIEAHFGKRIRDMSLDEQLAAVDWELREGGEQRAGGILAGITTAPQAGAAVSRNYERPRDVEGEAYSRSVSANSMFFNAQKMAAAAAAAPGAGGAVTPTPVVVTQSTNVTVHGAGQPQETADAVRGQLDRRDADLVRNMKGAVQ